MKESVHLARKHLLYLAALKLLKDHEAGRRVDPNGLEWARWNVRVNAPKPQPISQEEGK